MGVRGFLGISDYILSLRISTPSSLSIRVRWIASNLVSCQSARLLVFPCPEVRIQIPEVEKSNFVFSNSILLKFENTDFKFLEPQNSET